MPGRGLFDSLIVRGRAALKMHDAAETKTAGVPDGTLRLYQDGANQYLQTFSLATGAWETFSPSALVAPAGADYLVGTSNAALSSEIVDGTTPGGELGGTWAAATVDATHAGSAHHARQHSISASTDHTAGTWKVFYSDGVGDIDQLSLGSSGTVFTSNGASSVPSFATPPAAGWVLAGSSSAETTFTNTAVADQITISGLSIAAGAPIKITLSFRLLADAGATRYVSVGLKLNTTTVVNPTVVMDAFASTAGSGSAEIYVAPRRTNYLRSLSFNAAGTGTSLYHVKKAGDADMPTATITSITLTGSVTNAAATGGIRDVYVYSLATT